MSEEEAARRILATDWLVEQVAVMNYATWLDRMLCAFVGHHPLYHPATGHYLTTRCRPFCRRCGEEL